jgi:hypothetical protein
MRPRKNVLRKECTEEKSFAGFGAQLVAALRMLQHCER